MTADGEPPTRWRSRLARFEPAAYAVFSGLWILTLACLFFSSIRLQTHLGSLGLQPEGIDQALAGKMLGEWSAPLDDVFIHFDFARAAARGHPFEWSEGNGYSSGGTSLLYPFVLAVGYWAGFRQLALMVWAGVVACVCVFGLLLASRRLFTDLPRWTSYLAPPIVLGVGALCWTLFSGMEVALLLALWAGALIAWDDLTKAAGDAARTTGGRFTPRAGAVVLGLWGAAMVATRPESAVAVAVFSVSAALLFWRRRGVSTAVTVLIAAALPGALVIVAHAVANLVFTGETSAAGALAKLELYHPHLSKERVWEAWKFHFSYQVLRVTHYHLSEIPGFGWILWVLAAAGLFSKRTRRYSVVLWLSALFWIAVVALNGQVRWQNERYTMPAVAWMLLASALGIGALLSARVARGRRGVVARVGGTALVVVSVGVLAWQQAPRFREQIWFFGRASRNIRDQHVLTGRLLRRMQPQPQRVLVGDAGAIPYTSDLPALDIIGLGGYHDLPFARATRWGIASSIELIERIPPDDRPDILAIYPSWWGSFPLWFGTRVVGVPVRGNVICGGHTKVVYRPSWEPLDRGASPATLERDERVVDAVDQADLVNEQQHDWLMEGDGIPFVAMKMLPDPREPGRDLWDAGRIVPAGIGERFRLDGLEAGRPAHLLVRAAVPQPTEVRVEVNGRHAGDLSIDVATSWQEVRLALPPDRVTRSLDVRLVSTNREHLFHHVWVTQRP